MRSEDSPRTAILVAVSVTVVLWASAFVFIRFAGRQLDPGALALGRLSVASLALGAAMLVRREALPRGRALAAAVLSGLLWFGLYNVVLNAAERRIDAGSASLLVNTGPLFLLVIAGVLLHEGFPRRLVAGSLVAFTGVVLIGLGVSRHGISATWGAALCIIAALAYALGVTAQKPALRTASPLAITWVACTVAVLGCLPWAGDLVREAGHARASTLGWTLYLGLGPTAIGFGSWSFALSHTEVGRLGVTTYLVPPISVALGWAILGEVPPLLALPGGLLCLAGVALARRRPRSVPTAGGSGQRPRAPVPEPTAASVAQELPLVPPTAQVTAGMNACSSQSAKRR